MRRTILLVIVALQLAACGTQTTPETAAPPTLLFTASAPTQTASPPPQSTVSPSPTQTTRATETTTPTPEPTQDLEVIITPPDELLLKVEDLPEDAHYYLEGSQWIARHSNSEVAGELTVRLGQEYLERTGRIDGWQVWYQRGTSMVKAPAVIYCSVVQFRSAVGARIQVEEYNNALYSAGGGWKAVSEDLALGDENRISQKSENGPGGEPFISYAIEFTYRNYAVEIQGRGLEHDLDPLYVQNVAQTMLEKLEGAQLGPPGSLDE